MMPSRSGPKPCVVWAWTLNLYGMFSFRSDTVKEVAALPFTWKERRSPARTPKTESLNKEAKEQGLFLISAVASFYTWKLKWGWCLTSTVQLFTGDHVAQDVSIGFAWFLPAQLQRVWTQSCEDQRSWSAGSAESERRPWTTAHTHIYSCLRTIKRYIHAIVW